MKPDVTAGRRPMTTPDRHADPTDPELIRPTMMAEIRVGDRVKDQDAGLAQLRAIMRSATGHEPHPNHHGTVREIDGDMAYVDYDDGGFAPCPITQLRHLREETDR